MVQEIDLTLFVVRRDFDRRVALACRVPGDCRGHKKDITTARSSVVYMGPHEHVVNLVSMHDETDAGADFLGARLTSHFLLKLSSRGRCARTLDNKRKLPDAADDESRRTLERTNLNQSECT